MKKLFFAAWLTLYTTLAFGGNYLGVLYSESIDIYNEGYNNYITKRKIVSQHYIIDSA